MMRRYPLVLKLFPAIVAVLVAVGTPDPKQDPPRFASEEVSARQRGM